MVRVPPLGGSQGSALARRAPRYCPSQVLNLAFPPTSRDFAVISEFRLQGLSIYSENGHFAIDLGTIFNDL
jgi:hypothetical protein